MTPSASSPQPMSDQTVLAWLKTVCTEKQYAAAELYYEHDMGVRQIARRLEVSPAVITDRLDAVKLKMYRARRDGVA